MHRYFLSLMFFSLTHLANANSKSGTFVILGRWDTTFRSGETELPPWLEIHTSGFKTLVGEFVGPGGSALPHINHKLRRREAESFHSATMGNRKFQSCF